MELTLSQMRKEDDRGLFSSQFLLFIFLTEVSALLEIWATILAVASMPGIT